MIKRTNRLAIILAFILLGAVYNTAAQNTESVTLALENADITELVKWASDVTSRNIILHPNVQGRVTVIARQPMSKDEAYQVFLSVLQVHGLVVVEENGSLKVIPNAQAKESAIPLAPGDLEAIAEDMVVQIVKVKNISANNLVNLLRPLIPQTAYLAASPETNSIIIADRANNIKKILDVITQMDQGGSVEIDIMPVMFANASEIMAILTELIKERNGPEDSGSAINIAVDNRSNSILITGDASARQQIRSLIQHLDKPLEGNGNALVMKIEYANAVELVPLLQTMATSIQKDSKSQGSETNDVSIQAHEQLNALIIAAPKALLDSIREVVKQLDVPRSQVMVEALIVEVTEDLARNLGVEWRTSNPGIGESVAGGFSSFPGELNPLSIEDGELSLGTGLSLGYFRGGDLRGIINLLSAQTNANILSTPTIVSLDNEEAEILVGSNVPFITGSQQRAGDVDPFQTIQRQDIGVTLKVKPRINNDNSVTLDIEQSVESIAPSTTGTADIVTNKRKIKTRVLIGDDDVLVLGGLMRDEVSDEEKRIPLLGKIPVLGHLFKSEAKKYTKTNLMVFIHPRILKNPDETRNASNERYDSIRKIQLEFGNSIKEPFTTEDLPSLPKRENDTSITPQ